MLSYIDDFMLLAVLFAGVIPFIGVVIAVVIAWSGDLRPEGALALRRRSWPLIVPTEPPAMSPHERSFMTRVAPVRVP
jgi:hypothetical protein